MRCFITVYHETDSRFSCKSQISNDFDVMVKNLRTVMAYLMLIKKKNMNIK